MHPPQVVELPADLPPAALAAFQRALSLRAALSDVDPDEDSEVGAAFAEGMAALGLPAFVPYTDDEGAVHGWTDRPIVPSDTLTAAQRAALVALVDASELFGCRFPVPATGWGRRQWLGLEPAGPLWAPGADGQPAFFALRELLLGDEDALVEHLRRMPLALRVPLLAEIDVSQSDLWCDTAELFADVVVKLDGSLGAWAQAFAERVLAGVPASEACNQDHDRAGLTFAALVAAGVPLEPRHDELLRLAVPRTPALLDAWIEAIPEERREAAILAALPKLSFMSGQVAAAVRLLTRWPYASLAIHAEANLAEAINRPGIKAGLKAVYAEHPSVKRAVAAWKKAQPKALTLKRVTGDALADLLPLDALAAAQLVVAARAYNGAACTVEDVLAGRCGGDDAILPETIRYSRFEGPRGKPAYELWSLMTDAGTFFVAGTTDVVGGVVEFSVDCPDVALARALRLAM
ncbi:MAG: hypothetical protein R3B06_03695 [Kofleriaceae bacterium]